MINLSRLLGLLPIFIIITGVNYNAIAETPPVAENTIAQGRIRSTFFEESQDSGFTNSFLSDALGGIANPLENTAGNNTTVNMTTGSDFLQTTENVRNRVTNDNRALPFNPLSNRSGNGSIVSPNNDTPITRPTGRGIFRSLPPSSR